MAIQAQLADGRILEFPDGTDPNVIQSTVKRLISEGVPSTFGAPAEKQSVFRQVADVPLGVAKGAVQGVRMIADAFGAGSSTSNTIRSAENYLADLMSAQAKNDQQAIARIMKDAEDKGVLDQVRAGIRAFTVAPVDTLSSALGTAAPVIAGALGAKILGAGAVAGTGISALLGGGMGAGVVKGSIYDETKKALLEAGASERDAEQRAQLAQQYDGKNLDQILLGTVLGGAAALGPLEKGAAGALARRILGKAAVEETGEAAVAQAAKGAVRRRLEAGAKEALPEMAQAAQEQIAQNIALQREGFDVPTMRGAVSAATLEGIAGGALGAGLGGGKPEIAPTPQPEAEVTPPAAAPAAPGVTPPAAEVPPQVVTLPPAETEAQRIARLQAMADADAEALAERARREGIQPVVPPRAPTPERTVPPLAEREIPEAAPREDLLAKQLEVDRRRMEAGLPTGQASPMPGQVAREALQPQGEAQPLPGQTVYTAPPLVDERPMTEKAAKNRLLVLQSLYKNAGRDPESLAIIPHPTVEEKFAIQSLDRPAQFSPNLPRTAAEAEPTPKVVDPVEAYVNIQRRMYAETNVESARRFVQEWEAGRITRADVEQAIEQYRKEIGEPPLDPKARGESALRSQLLAERFAQEVPFVYRDGEKPFVKETEKPTVEEPPVKKEEEPPVPTVEMPKTLAEFKERMPTIRDSAKLRAANNSQSFEKLVDALASSSNPTIARIGELGKKISKQVRLLPPKDLGSGVGGVYNRAYDTVQLTPSTAGSEKINAHEVVHALLSRSQVKAVSAKQDKLAQEIKDLHQFVKKEVRKRGISPSSIYGLKNDREFAAEAMSNPDFQYLLMTIPYKGKRSAWSEFTRIVAEFLGIKDPNALSEIINLVDRLAQTKRAPYSEGAFAPSDFAAAPEEGEAERAPLPPNATPMDVVGFMGIKPQKQEEGIVERTKRLRQEFKEDPELTKSSIAKAVLQFKDKMENNVFSSDAAFNNKVRSELIKDIDQNKDVIGTLIEMSQSQTVHSDAVAGVFLQMGGLRYDNDAKKWVGFQEENNFINLSRKVDEIAKKYNMTKDQAMLTAHAYFVAKRLRSLKDRNAEIEAKIASLPKGDPEIKKLQESIFEPHLNEDQIQAGLDLEKQIPELRDVVDVWNGIRSNTVKLLVQSGMWTEKFANDMLDNIDYVPFYREEQLEEGEGPAEFVRGLQVKAKEYRIKGSENPVNDVFDNMMRWTQYAVNRAIRNHKSLQLIDTALEIDVDDGKMAEKVDEPKKGENIVRVFRDGKQEYYRMADPLFMDAFLPVQNVTMPSLKVFSWFANLLRQSVVLFPLFSVAQVPQDAFAAMFTSGLQPKFALRIPFLAAREYVQTLTKTSALHNQLKKYGVVGVRDFSSSVIRDDAEIMAGLKPQQTWWGKTLSGLQHISMSADNAVRQAVYDAAMQQGLSKAEALEKAFDIINFRRKPKSLALNIAGQTIPFFYAYLAAQRVAYNTLSGVGISPQERKAGWKTLMYTSAAVMALSMLYAMLNEDDEDYRDTPTALRDRTITIPGSGGVRIPLRVDFFLFPKVIAEHAYHHLVDSGMTDKTKFLTSMKDAVLSSILAPGPFPQAVKAPIEVAINYDFYQGRPLIGFFDQKKDAERQFNINTSEFGKVVGSTGLISPIAVDHLMRGMFGSVGGLFLWGTNKMINTFGPDVERPTEEWQDAISALPSAGAFLKKSTQSALKNDFYQLRDEVEKAKNTFNDYKNYSPEGIDDFIANEDKMAKLALSKQVEKISDQLAKVRKAIKQVTISPMMTGEEKQEKIRELREIENEMLKAVDVPGLRKMAKL